uniref:NADH dehydrogenase subunit 1 n=1 Tax=Panagrellus redivivus TaxID=6233 RepID=A0A7E4VWE0_PANRE
MPVISLALIGWQYGYPEGMKL